MHDSFPDNLEPNKLDPEPQVIEESRNMRLLYNPRTKSFLIHNLSSGRLTFPIRDWARAYRIWLALEHKNTPQTSKQVLSNSITFLLQQVDLSQSSPVFGRLLYQRDRQYPDLLFYLVQLNETSALSWKPIFNSQVGQLQIESLGRRRHRVAKWVEESPRADITKALRYSVEFLHQKCFYSLLEFNSEHWARVVTTGLCHCYQAQEIDDLRKVNFETHSLSALPENLGIAKLFSRFLSTY
jgi:hypothetical protein